MKHIFSLVYGLFLAVATWSQGDSLPRPPARDFTATGGLVAYYFWEEDSAGYIRKLSFQQPFIQNYFITRNTRETPGVTPSRDELKRLINRFANDPRMSYRKRQYVLLDSLKRKNKLYFPLVKTSALTYGSVSFINRNNEWESRQLQKVLYFTLTPQGMSYAHSSDSIALVGREPVAAEAGQYYVYTYIGDSGTVDRQRVFAYSGEEVTERMYQPAAIAPARILVFANGYRGPKKDDDSSDDLVTQKDRYHYWYKIDDRFIKALSPTVSYYMDGSLPIWTSSHQTKWSFLWSYLKTRFTRRKVRSKQHFERLNTEPNEAGFNERKAKGKIAGLAFLYATCHEPECNGIKDTLDIVCHSMGYAYSLGFLDAVKDKVVLGTIYIIAAESACADGFDWTLFQHVWQYGSNLDQPNADPLWEQDGIAPQCAVKGLDLLPPNRGGRAFIPADWPNKDFVESHMIYSYDWIFDRIPPGAPCYVGR